MDLALDKGNSPLRTQRTQRVKMYERPGPTGRGGKEECGGTRFLCKKLLRARRPCISGHRSVSRALSLKMHVGSTPSGPAPPPARTSILLAVNYAGMQACGLLSAPMQGLGHIRSCLTFQRASPLDL